MILFVHFDGVLHPGPIIGRSGEADLFRSLYLLEEVLRRVPYVEVAISSLSRAVPPRELARNLLRKEPIELLCALARVPPTAPGPARQCSQKTMNEAPFRKRWPPGLARQSRAMKRYQLKVPANGVAPVSMPPEHSNKADCLLTSTFRCLAQVRRSGRFGPLSAEELVAELSTCAGSAAPTVEAVRARLQRLRELGLVTVSHSV